MKCSTWFGYLPLLVVSAAACGGGGVQQEAASSVAGKESAEEAHRGAVRARVPEASAEVRRAERLLREGEAAEALSVLRAWVRRSPSDARAWYQVGFAAEEVGDEALALQGYERAVRLEPAFALAWVNLSRLRLSLRHFDGAVDAARRAVTLDPDLSEGWVNLALALEQSGQEEEALRAFERAASLRTRDASVRANLGQLALRLGHEERARAALLEALPLALRDGEPAILLAVGNGLRRLGEAEGARRAMEAAVDAYRTAHEGRATAALLSELALARRAAGDGSAAREALEEALRLDEHYATAHYLLAAFAASDGDRDTAVHHLRACLRIAQGAERERCEGLAGRLDAR